MYAKTTRCKFGIPKGRSRYVIYAVVLRAHPDVVKLGRTMNWKSRRGEYDNWNLAKGDGILESAVYCITEECVDLASIEAACLGAMQRHPYRGNEWFKGTLSEARAAIEDVLCTAQISFDEF